ncbi:MAG: glycosyltransferase [bacterium]
MIRVLHVIDSLHTGGAERQLTEMLVRSDAQLFSHTVCALWGDEPHGARLRAARIPVYAFRRVPRHEIVRTTRQLRTLIREVAPDVVHTSLYWAGVLGRAAACLEGKPVVTTLVNTTYEPEWRMDNPRLTPVKVAIARTIDGVTARWFGSSFVAISQAVRSSAIRQLGIPPHRITVIPRGLSLDEEPTSLDQVARLRAQLGWDGGYPVVLTVGRLVPQKGHRYAIEAMPRIWKAFPRAVLAVAGEGWLHGELQRLAHSNGQTRIQFLGERHDVLALLAAADVFIFPSLFEGFGVAFLEALRAGRPCVASRIPALEEVTDGGRVALLVDPCAPEALADAVIKLADDRDLAASLSRQAAAWVRAQFDITTSIRRLEEVFRTVAGGRAVGAADDRAGPITGGSYR